MIIILDRFLATCSFATNCKVAREGETGWRQSTGVKVNAGRGAKGNGGGKHGEWGGR